MSSLPTPRQLETLKLISRSSIECGTPPSLRELCRLLRVSSTNAVSQLLDGLEAKGLIERGSHGTARTLRLTLKGSEVLTKVALAGGVPVTEGVRCCRCNGLTFAPDRPCPLCAALRRPLLREAV